ncbi:hypothetical protein BOTBODRAFT_34471 [Botryobasidium botryosum FD-172 SS1]|uniref:(S)-ureidoglycine aminohydrolase cupin domain-containing protein n=1 Tax=Botryobasidium botryosum (strain FD-172 SS1) TaxID=930990 RepID=A0A067M9R0_BOTB1|nr:hypothetical protein BOTBODRAFT_34471 [Botryobasidium botryosum FD-172 SS1]
MGIHSHSQGPQAISASPFKHGLSYNEVFGTKEGGTPLTAGLFDITQSDSVNFVYPGDEFLYIISGEVHLEDEDKKEVTKLKAGDIGHIQKGTRTKWSTPSQGKGFWVSQKEHGASLHEHTY